MTTMKKFVPVMLTPFDETGAIDFATLTKLTEYYIEAGAKGLFANCLSSEMYELTNEERIAITEHIIEVAAGSVPVVSTGTFGGPLEKQADFIKRINDTGTSAVIVINSILADAHEADAVLSERIFELFDKTAAIPLGFYECPVPYKRTFDAQQVLSFVATGRVLYYKDTCMSLDSISSKLEATAGFPSFELYDAHMANAVGSLRAGCAGLSCIQGNYTPELVTWLAENYDDPALENEVEKVQSFFTRNMTVMHEFYPTVAKYFLKQKGLPISLHTRRNIGSLPNRTREKIDKLVLESDEILSDLGISTRINA